MKLKKILTKIILLLLPIFILSGTCIYENNQKISKKDFESSIVIKKKKSKVTADIGLSTVRKMIDGVNYYVYPITYLAFDDGKAIESLNKDLVFYENQLMDGEYLNKDGEITYYEVTFPYNVFNFNGDFDIKTLNKSTTVHYIERLDFTDKGFYKNNNYKKDLEQDLNNTINSWYKNYLENFKSAKHINLHKTIILLIIYYVILLLLLIGHKIYKKRYKNTNIDKDICKSKIIKSSKNTMSLFVIALLLASSLGIQNVNANNQEDNQNTNNEKYTVLQTDNIPNKDISLPDSIINNTQNNESNDLNNSENFDKYITIDGKKYPEVNGYAITDSYRNMSLVQPRAPQQTCTSCTYKYGRLKKSAGWILAYYTDHENKPAEIAPQFWEAVSYQYTIKDNGTINPNISLTIAFEGGTTNTIYTNEWLTCVEFSFRDKTAIMHFPRNKNRLNNRNCTSPLAKIAPFNYDLQKKTIDFNSVPYGTYTFKGTLIEHDPEIPYQTGQNFSFPITIARPNFTAYFDGNGGTPTFGSITRAHGVALGDLPSASRPGYTFQGWYTSPSGGNKISSSTTMPGHNVTYYAHWTQNTHAFDLNGLINGYAYPNIRPAGTADIYINGSLVANDVTDFFQRYPYGTKYEIRDIRPSTGYVYNGVSSGSISGTIGVDTVVQLSFSDAIYNNQIYHWMWGFKHGEGNNGTAKNAFNISTTSFNAKYNSHFSIDASRSVRIPNGFKLRNTFGTAFISGNWDIYPMPKTLAQVANNMTFEYDYDPIIYNISYNLNGGTNNSNNPTTYNVLYGVQFQEPTRPGYTFAGWTINGKKANGINVGANASFSSPSDMYNKLASRTTGNVTVVATWNKKPTLTLKDFSVIEGDNFPVSNLIDGKGYITKGDSQFPDKLIEVNYPAKANDDEEGDISHKIHVDKVVGPNGEILNNVDTSKIGDYIVYYSVTDNIGGTTSGTRKITVLPSCIPKIQAEDRYFYRGTNITTNMLIDKIKATDKYDGDITSKVTIPDFSNIKSNITGDYEITYTVTNRSHKTTTKKVIVHIIDTMQDIQTPYRIRFISKEYLDTIDRNSKWITNSALNKELTDSLNSITKNKAKRIFTFTNKEIKNIQKDIKINGFKK